MRIGIFIQARSNSSRLANKIFERIGGDEMLTHVIWSSLSVNALVKANKYVTAVLCPENDAKLIEWVEFKKFKKHDKELKLFAGSEENLMERYIKAIEHFECDAAIRITGDCPFIPTFIIDECIKGLAEADYVSNTVIRSYPEGWDVQGASLRAWQWYAKTQEEWKDEETTEHPWKLFDENQIIRKMFLNAGFTFRLLVNSKNEIFQKTSIDTPEELERARKEYEARQPMERPS